MNSVDTLVKKSILSYPSLHQSRTEVLHFVLCVIGNGYAWDENGEIANLHPEEDKPWSAEDEIKNHHETYAEFRDEKLNAEDQAFFLDILSKPLARKIAICEERVRNVDELMTKRTAIEHFYTQSRFALLLNMPANVSADWAAACREIQKEAMEHGWVF